MAVFENESNASQDANYREHLDRNWQNGNTAFDDLFGKYNGLLDEYDAVNNRLDDAERKIRDLQDKNIALSQRCDKIEETHREDIEELTALVDKLNKAVFGLAPAEINTPPVPDYSNKQLEEINFDDRKDKTDKW